ncbi:MAG: tetratricopeptide repeat protein [Planctomycetota bacterium]|jgi:hypothetical protein
MHRGESLGLFLVIAIGLGVGCDTPERSEGTSGRSASPTFERLLDMEEEGKFLEALEVYGAIAADGGRSSTDRVRAQFRMARCREERGERDLARDAYKGILTRVDLVADEGRLPPVGAVGIYMRLQAEAGLERVGSNLAVFYSALAISGKPEERLVAVRSLGRLKHGRGRSALLTVLRDPKGGEVLQQAAKEALEALDKAENRKSGKSD